MIDTATVRNVRVRLANHRPLSMLESSELSVDDTRPSPVSGKTEATRERNKANMLREEICTIVTQWCKTCTS